MGVRIFPDISELVLRDEAINDCGKSLPEF